MSDPLLVREILTQMLSAVGRIERRFSRIAVPSDFVTSPEGMDMLDAIAMMLIAIGESCKNLDKVTQAALLLRYPQVDWKGVKGMRDVISHHYFDINAELIFNVCHQHIPILRATLETMLRELTS